MSDTNIINKYAVQQRDNGDLVIEEIRQSIAVAIFFGLLAAAFVAATVFIDREIRYLFGIIAVMLLVVTFGKLRQYAKPMKLHVHRESNMLEIVGATVNEKIAATDIRCLRFFHQAMHATTTGSIVGVGPKVHWQQILLIRKDGRELVLLYLRNQELNKATVEAAEAEELMKLIQGAFSVPVAIE